MEKFITCFILFTLTFSCNNKTQDVVAANKKSNDLIEETSPYLLQHAYNPVDWKPWGDAALEKAQKENKLLVISIGYSSCHWCHVMEEESFEDDSIAKLMNENYISIKVDREERPDIDQVYMDAVQMMTGSGGWPLNVIALPDGRPLYGGTYHTKSQWEQILNRMKELYQEKPEDLIKYAAELTEGIHNYNLVETNPENPDFTKQILEQGIEGQRDQWDTKMGGTKQSTKFPLPNNLEFIMRYGFQSESEEVLKYIETTLNNMAFGGIYDQVGGGFSRYSTDVKWHVPHFEKMLYDNAQLVSLYSKAYALTQNELYKQTVTETLEFIERELTNEEGAFYSSLDADSKDDDGNLEEGTYYVWKKDTLQQLLKDDFEIFKEYYNINSYGLWEKGNYVLIRKSEDEAFATENNIPLSELKTKINSWKEILNTARNKRNRPRLDDKTLTSWNGLMLDGYIDAYQAFKTSEYLQTAEKNANFIVSNLMKKDGGLFHNYKDGRATINGYLEDYATVISAFINLYGVTADEKYLERAKDLNDYSLKHFYDEKSGLFYFTSDEDSKLITRKTEVYDNVISSSNSIMANNIFKLSHYYGNSEYKVIAEKMLNNVLPQIEESPSAYGNWLSLLADFVGPYYEVAISGPNGVEKTKEITSHYLPNVLFATANKESTVPLMENRFNDDDTYIFICVDGTCQLPVTETSKALGMIKRNFESNTK
ncbi:hypothetical protein SAMN03097699_3164 [Flavobacteriaceae bacterium MAR_2010_188]|nr:hypothetical protein SAMN03097699_3164 [Flavobacteriaceae bacterium MAR_2010_188]